MSDEVKPIVYADPRVSHVTDELEQYAVAIVSARRRHLRAFQIHEWLKLLRKDLPELAEHVDPLLSAVVLPRPEKK